MEQHPINSRPEEESIFSEEEFSMKGYDKHVRNARITIYVLAGLSVFGILQFAPFTDTARIVAAVIMVIFAGIFLLLGLWSRKKPYTALLTTLITYVSLMVLGAVFQPTSLLQGWIIKIGVLVLLVLGVRNGKDIQDRMETFGTK